MNSRYKEYSQLNLPGIGTEILKKWDENNAFEKSVDLRNGNKPFVFYEGPPSANGMPGIHHVISRTLKDLICRYKTMKGYQVKRKGGWDTHGLPIELGVEKLLGITKEDIGKKISVEEYNAICRREVLKFKDKWDDLTKHMGYWVDLKNPYITFENDYVESLWWSLKVLYEKKLLYEDISIQPYSPAAGTGLSSHELNQPGTYKDVKDTSCVAMFSLSRAPGANGQVKPATVFASDLLTLVRNAWSSSPSLAGQTPGEGVFFLAWTTTPWTLPSNLGLTVGKNIDYVLIKTFNPYTHLPINVILAKSLLQKYFKPEAEGIDFENYREEDKIIPWKILTEFKGSEVEGCEYEQLLPFESNSLEKIREVTPGAEPFRVITGDFVTTEEGTGIVHTAPAFGADDFKAGKKNNLGILVLVDKEGKFIEGTGEFSGRFVKDYKDDPEYVDVNVDICVKLKKENRAFKIEKYEHSYPHCWRTDKPVIYYPLDAWFIKTTAVKERMIELNNTINWKPASTGTGRFGNWLENMVDWNLSRSRYWGTPLPIWRSEDGTEERCIGSIEELGIEIKKANTILGNNINKSYLHDGKLDLHKPYVDDIILVGGKDKPMYRIPDLIDVWFDSGAMPFAQWHFPFENTETFTQSFPADFIAEGVDQTRGWFYTLHALGVLLFDNVAYKNVVSNGLVLDKHGNKMSKRVGNVVDPFETLDQFGPDATRWYLITNASPWDSLKFDADGIKEVQRKFFGTLYNTYQFFALYANVDGFVFDEDPVPANERPEIDRWILSALNTLIRTVEQSLDDYEPTQAGRAIENFVDEQLSNWYVRLCRRRFWKGEYEWDKICAYQTLYECIETLSKLIAPIAPFFADWLFCSLNTVTKRSGYESVHHTDFPSADMTVINAFLEKRMQLAQDISSLILSIRKKVNIKVRQPLQKALIPASNKEFAEDIRLVENIIKTETNIKEIEILSGENNFIKKKAKANFKTLGKKLGAKMKWASHEIEKLKSTDIESIYIDIFLLNKDFTQKNEDPVYISADDIEVTTDEIPGFEVASRGSITVALDITLSPALTMEGEAREFVNRIQNIRKDKNFEVTDKIIVKVSENESLKTSFTQFNNYICAEILAEKIEFVSEILDGTSIMVNSTPLKVDVIKKETIMAVKKKMIKAIPKKQIAKKASAKKVIGTTPKKTLAPGKGTQKKTATKKTLSGKLVAKGKPASLSKRAKLTKPSAPVKKPANPAAKKAVPKKLPLSKKNNIKKVTSPPAKKHAEKPDKKVESKKVAKIAGEKSLPKAKDIKVPPPKPVVLPKITTTKSRKYEPDFTKSVLDHAAPENNGPTMRYSDSELNEFRELIQRKLETAKKELAYLQGLITRKDEMGGDDTDNRYMTMEDGSLSMEREQLSQMASRQITFIDHLEKAMMRIENKTYGICRVTGKLIDKARLRAVPHATLSIEAKMGIVK